MTELWDKIKKNLVHTLNDAIDKTEELTSVGRIKLEILQLEHRLDEQFTELGTIFYKDFDRYKDLFDENEKYLELKNEIDKLKKELRKKEKELGRIRDEDGIDFDS